MIETKKLLRNGDRILKKKNSSEMQKEKRQRRDLK